MKGQNSVGLRPRNVPWRSLALAFMVLPFLTVSELIADFAGLLTGQTAPTAVVETEDSTAPLGGEGDNGDPGTPHP